MTRTARLFGILLLAAPSAFARPPQFAKFLNLQELAEEIDRKRILKKEQEELAARPEEEQMLVALGRGEKSFKEQKLTPDGAVKQILGWKNLLSKTPSEEVVRIAGRLPEALKEIYSQARTDWKKSDRKKTSLALVRGLDSSFYAVRKVSIDALKAIYDTPLFYSPDETATKRERDKWIDQWRDYIDRNNK